MNQKRALVSTTNCTLSTSLSPSSGNARSTWITLPNAERLEPSRTPTPKFLSSPSLVAPVTSVPQVRPTSKNAAPATWNRRNGYQPV